MDIIKMITIHDLAQNFLKAPRISMKNNGLYLTYDFEMTSGVYDEKRIYFDDVKDYRYVDEKNVTVEMINAAYNSIAKVIDSDWISKDLISQGFNHFIVYFEEYGAYEIIAKDCRL